MGVGLGRMSTWIALVMLALAGRAAMAQGPAESGPAPVAAGPVSKLRVAHVKLCGDLDNTRLVKQFADELAWCRQEKFELLVLEMGGDRWRGDVVSEMIRAAGAAGIGSSSGASGLPWIVWLNDPADSRVGGGQAAIAAAADRCYLGPKVRIVCEPGDEARELAPESPEMNWEQVEHELQGVVWSRLKARGGDLLLASALPSPRQRLWAVAGRGGAGEPVLRLVTEEPAGAGGVAAGAAVVLPAAGAGGPGLGLRLEADQAAGLGLAAGQAKELAQILTARRIVPRPVVRREIVSGLGGARERLEKEFAAIDAAREQLDQSLDEAERARGQDAAKRRARAGADGVALADRAVARLLKVEELTVEYPELLRAAPPGQSEVGLPASRRPYVWNEAFQSRRESLAALRARAVRLAAER